MSLGHHNRFSHHHRVKAHLNRHVTRQMDAPHPGAHRQLQSRALAPPKKEEGFFDKLFHSHADAPQTAAGPGAGVKPLHHFEKWSSVEKLPLDPANPVDRIVMAKATIESGGMKAGYGNFSDVGSVIQKGSHKGHQALGITQVMSDEVAERCKKAGLGSVTPQEFYKSKELQIAEARYQASEELKAGLTPSQIARQHFAGSPKATNHDHLINDGHINIPTYVGRFNVAYKQVAKLGNVNVAENGKAMPAERNGSRRSLKAESVPLPKERPAEADQQPTTVVAANTRGLDDKQSNTFEERFSAAKPSGVPSRVPTMTP